MKITIPDMIVLPAFKSVETDPPPDNHKVLLCHRHWYTGEVVFRVGCYRWGERGDGWSTMSSDSEATHWTELPDPPTSLEASGGWGRSSIGQTRGA